MSCVPPGEYELEYHNYKGHTDTWALIGDTVSHFKTDKSRYLIVIHPANKPHELKGCIAPGVSKSVDKVKDSTKALNKLRNVIISKNIGNLRII